MSDMTPIWCPDCGCRFLAQLRPVAELAKLREENARLRSAVADLLKLCSCEDGLIERRTYDAASNEMEWAGYDTCKRCEKARTLLKVAAPPPLSPDDEAAVRAWFRDREAK